MSISPDHTPPSIPLTPFFNGSSDLMCVLGAEARFLRVNPRMAAMLGRAEADLLGLAFLDFVHPEDRTATQVAFAQLQATPASTQVTLRWRHRDGTFGDLAWSFHAEEAGLIYASAREVEVPPPAVVALREAEQHTTRILESIGDAFFSLDADWRFTYINDEAERILLRGRDDLLGQNIWTLYADAVGLVFYQQYHRARAMRETVQFEAYYPPLDCWFRVKVYPYDGGLSVYFSDITQRKVVEQEYREANRLLQAVADAQSHYIAHDDPDSLSERLLRELLSLTQSSYGFIAEVIRKPGSTSSLKMMALTQGEGEDVIRSFYEQQGSEQAGLTPFEALLSEALQTGKPVLEHAPDKLIELGRLAPDHPPLESFLGMPVFYGEEMTGLIGIANRPGGYDAMLLNYLQPFLNTCSHIVQAWRIEDQRREAEEARRHTEAQARRLALVASRTTNSVIITDTEGRVEWANEGFTRLTGYQLEEVKGKTPGAVLQGEGTDPATVAYIREGLRRRANVVATILNYTKDGRPYYTTLDIQPLFEPDGRFTGFMSVQSDVTERVRSRTALEDYAAQLEQQKLQLQAMVRELDEARIVAETAASSKSAFMATMSHEIRTPMNGVIGMTSLLLETPLNEEQRDFVETIRISGDALLNIINDILDFSKIEAGHLQLEQEAFDLRPCIEEVIDLLAPSAANQGLDFAYYVEPEVPEQLTGDRTRIRQVLINLVSNAIKFTKAGEVELRVRLEARSSAAPFLVFSVRDTGIGIPEAKLNVLFDAFTQADASTTRKYGGTGLGLAICKRLAEAMAGTITVTSREGEGSTFALEIPVHTLHPAPAMPQLAPATLLVVTASALQQRIVHDLASAWGLTVVAAPDATGALRRLAVEGPPHLILTDIALPDMNGLDLAVQVQANYEDLPVLLLAPAGVASSLAEGTRRQVLNKPVKPAHLQACIEAVHGAATPPPQPVATPASAASRPTVIEPVRSQTPVSATRILVVEDNLVNQKVIIRMLDRMQFAADLASDGAEAVTAVAERDYDAVLMDIHMPGMDGLAATREIRASLPPERQPPIIALTANALKGDAERCLEAGMDAYLSKPVKLSELADMLARFVNAPQPDA